MEEMGKFGKLGKLVLVINGPNMNMLGKRPTDIYGTETYDDLKAMIESFAFEERNRCRVLPIEFGRWHN